MTSTPQRDPATDPLSFVLLTMGRAIEGRLNLALRHSCLTASQALALRAIANSPELSRADLGRALNVSAQAAGGVAAQLLEKELITRTETAPGHPVAFTVTAHGLRTICEIRSITSEMDHELLKHLPMKIGGLVDQAVRHMLRSLDRHCR